MYIDYIGSPSDAYLILFTFVLAISTIALWNATRDAANAAKIAAEHIPTVERAYVYPRVVSNNITVSMEEIANGGDPARFPQQIGFRIKNYGKTPAFLRDVVGHLGYFSNEPRIHTADDTHISGDVALEAGGETETFTAWLKPPLTPTEIMEIYGGEATLMFSGWITFDDIWGDPQPSRQFSWTWNDTKGVFVPHLERHQKQQ